MSSYLTGKQNHTSMELELYKDLVIGLIGTGKIGSAVVTGFCSDGGWQPKQVFVSSRTKSKADALVKKFPTKVIIGKSNQEIIDKSDIIFIGLLPDVAKEVKNPGDPIIFYIYLTSLLSIFL
jgi:pyrroline-5-carboxylate reductase